MIARTSLVTVGALAMAFFWGAVAANAWSNGSHLTYLTFARSFALPGVTLPAGTYAFDVVDPAAAANVVRVRNRDRSRTYYFGMTVRVPRPNGLRPDRQVQFGEVASGTVPPIVAWYPADAPIGHEFIYSR